MRETEDRMRAAFARRLHEAVDQIAQTADARTLEQVLGMADPFGGLAVALEHAVTVRAVRKKS